VESTNPALAHQIVSIIDLILGASLSLDGQYIILDGYLDVARGNPWHRCTYYNVIAFSDYV
jgi:hypothetical protein